MNYWYKCIEEAFEDLGITATAGQIDGVASWVEGAHDNHGMAHGHECIPNPLRAENDRLERSLAEEQSKVLCILCNGRDSITIDGPCHSSTSTCWKCRGEGRHLP